MGEVKKIKDRKKKQQRSVSLLGEEKEERLLAD